MLQRNSLRKILQEVDHDRFFFFFFFFDEKNNFIEAEKETQQTTNTYTALYEHSDSMIC